MTIRKEVIIGDCRLLLADCQDVLPTLGKVDAVATDPPYGIGAYKTGTMGGGVLARQSTYAATEWDESPCSPEILKMMRDISDNQIIFGGNYFELPPARCWLVWDKENGDTDFADCELAWTNLDKAVRMIKWRWHGMLRKGNDGERVHPTQKPTGVMEWCISHLPDTSLTILDPFMGSGTTGVACVKMGRKFIGIEREEAYFEIACRRIREAYAQPDIFLEAEKQMKQEALL